VCVCVWVSLALLESLFFLLFVILYSLLRGCCYFFFFCATSGETAAACSAEELRFEVAPPSLSYFSLLCVCSGFCSRRCICVPFGVTGEWGRASNTHTQQKKKRRTTSCCAVGCQCVVMYDALRAWRCHRLLLPPSTPSLHLQPTLFPFSLMASLVFSHAFHFSFEKTTNEEEKKSGGDKRGGEGRLRCSSCTLPLHFVLGKTSSGTLLFSFFRFSCPLLIGHFFVFFLCCCCCVAAVADQPPLSLPFSWDALHADNVAAVVALLLLLPAAGQISFLWWRAYTASLRCGRRCWLSALPL
jgi:hypothetical protein